MIGNKTLCFRRKRRNTVRNVRRVLALVMIFSILPLGGTAVSASEVQISETWTSGGWMSGAQASEQGYQIYACVPEEKWTDMRCYAYVKKTDENGQETIIKNQEWPGESMKDLGEGYWTYTLPENVADPQVQIIFYSSDVNRYPADQMPGLTCNNEGIWMFDFHDSLNYTWKKHDEETHLYKKGVCAICNAHAVAKTGNDYYASIGEAWTAAKGKTAEVTLLADAATDETLCVEEGDQITLTSEGGYTLTYTPVSGNGEALSVNGGRLAVTGGIINAEGDESCGVNISGGEFEITGGTVSATGASGKGMVVTGGKARIGGDAVIAGGGYGVYYGKSAADVKLSGGTFTGGIHSVYCYEGTAGGLLMNYGSAKGEHYAYYKEGKPVISGLDGNSLSGGTFAVQECTHAEDICVYKPADNQEYHQITCSACGYVKEPEPCEYGALTPDGAENHTASCVKCGRKSTERHASEKFSASVKDTLITVTSKCDKCGYETEEGTLAIHIPGSLAYGATKGKKVTWDTELAFLQGMNFAVDNGEPEICDSEYLLPELSKGTHHLKITMSIKTEAGTVKSVPEIAIPFSVGEAAGNEPDTGDNQGEEKYRPQVKSVKLSKTVYTYDGKAKKPSVIATNTDGKRISSNNYDVKYSNNKKAGKATVTITFKNNYSGTVKRTYTIRPVKTNVKKITAVSHGFTLRWAKKNTQTSGYQIQYSTNSGFKGSSTRSKTVKKTSVTKKTVKRLKAGKKYFVRIRTYKTVRTGGKSEKIYSAWSKAVKVKVK